MDLPDLSTLHFLSSIYWQQLYAGQANYNLYQQQLMEQQLFQQQLMMSQNVAVDPVSRLSAFAATPTSASREQLKRGSWNGPTNAYLSRREGSQQNWEKPGYSVQYSGKRKRVRLLLPQRDSATGNTDL
ncbi:hypothetical protein Aduo_016005 [Ancylostoma duodenale]